MFRSHNIFHFGLMQEFFAGQRRAWLKWPKGKYTNVINAQVVKNYGGVQI